MNKAEARDIRERHLLEYKSLPYFKLLRLLHATDSTEAMGESGAIYQIELEAIWDDAPGGDLRVTGTADDGKLLSSIQPLCSDFIVRPDGSLVGE